MKKQEKEKTDQIVELKKSDPVFALVEVELSDYCKWNTANDESSTGKGALVIALDNSSSMVWGEDDFTPNRWREIVTCTKSFLWRARSRMHPDTLLIMYKFSKDIEEGVFEGKLSDDVPPDFWVQVGTYTEYGPPIIFMLNKLNPIISKLSVVNFILITDGSGPCRDRDVKAITNLVDEKHEDWRSSLGDNVTKMNSLVITEAEVFHWTSEPIYSLVTCITDAFKSFSKEKRRGMCYSSRGEEIVDLCEVEEFD